jgi:UDP-N-acetyl-D-mannosaminuronic acid dehydrogenase
MTYDILLNKIQEKKAEVGVIGLGRVGLPTALSFCKSGFNVIGYDIDRNLLSIIDSKKSPFEEENIDNILKSSLENKKFHTTYNIQEFVNDSDVIIVCVATPITGDIRPDLSYLENVCNSLAEFSLSGKIIIIESSIPPGTFNILVLPRIGKKNRIGKDCWVAFVPERFAPGNAFSEIRTTPRVIGTVDDDSGKLAKKLYEKIVTSQVFTTTAQIAEVAKLVENTYRDVNVALANEVGLICEKYGIDVLELIKVCNSHPRVKLLQPGPGVGGPCLPKDPYLLLNPQGNELINSKIILDSRKINDSMPYHVVNLILKALETQKKTPVSSTVLILGVAYKADVSDTRFSPAKDVISQLKKNGCKVLVFDPKTKEGFDGEVIIDLWEAISHSDVLVILTDHNEFKKLDLEKIYITMKKIPIIVDTRRVFDNRKAEEIGIKYVSVGYTKNLL